MLKELSLFKELDGFVAARKHIDSHRCCFLTAFRPSVEALLGDIRRSGLAHITMTCGPTARIDAFCVVNNRFQEADFNRLMLGWCRKYGQDSILVSFPAGAGHGICYKADGTVEKETGEVAWSDLSEYFTRVRGKRFRVTSSAFVETESRGYDNVAGRYLAGAEFWRMYREELGLPWREESGKPKGDA